MGEKEKVLKAVREAASSEEIDAALDSLSELMAKMPGHEELYFARAELFYRLNKYGQAINDYLRVLEINPDNKEAAGKIDILKTILRFHNTDIYANPNTDMDPWLE
jgi:tetratricopeptide (TPR) repeat protein